MASRVAEAYQTTIGGTHPFTLVAENNISTYLRGVGSPHDALDVADRTLTAMQASLDEDHPFTLSCQINKANCLHDLGRLSEAESLQRRHTWSG